MEINVPKELTPTMEKKLLAWLQKKAPAIFAAVTVQSFGDLLEKQCFGRDAFQAADNLENMLGWPVDAELVFILADKAY